jgi:hypothetical protein
VDYEKQKAAGGAQTRGKKGIPMKRRQPDRTFQPSV